MVSAEALPTIRDQPLDDSETRVLEIVEEGVEGEIMWGRRNGRPLLEVLTRGLVGGSLTVGK